MRSARLRQVIAAANVASGSEGRLWLGHHSCEGWLSPHRSRHREVKDHCFVAAGEKFGCDGRDGIPVSAPLGQFHRSAVDLIPPSLLQRPTWRAQLCAPEQASMPIEQGGSLATISSNWSRRTLGRTRQARSAASTPCRANTFLAIWFVVSA